MVFLSLMLKGKANRWTNIIIGMALVFVSATILTLLVNWALPTMINRCSTIEYNTLQTLFGRVSLVKCYGNEQETLVQS
jgi:hypothetical protein